MRVKVLSIGLLGATWALGLVLPHFQPDPNFFELMLDSVVVLTLAYSLWFVLDNAFLSSLKVSYGLTAFYVVLFLLSYLLLKLGSPTLYDLWSHLGSGSMEYEGSLFPFGDLVHFTAAAGCVTGIEIGVNSCDPWQRAFNQNPDISRFLDLIRLANVDLLGVGSYVFLTLLLILIIRERNLGSIAFIIFIASPPFVLAIDRGNEIITIFFILLGLVFLESSNKYCKPFAVVFLFAGAIFKLWPILLIAFLTLFASKSKRRYLLIAFVLSAGYWLSSANKITKMLSATQDGSPHGMAFGLKLFFSDQTSLINVGYLVALTILIAAIWINYFGRSLTASFKSPIPDHRYTILIPTLLTYVGIWIFSDSFIYRMLILLPALLILISQDLLSRAWVKGSVVLILVTVLSSRLAITTAISSSLALVFLFVSFMYAWARILNHISQRQVSKEGLAESR